MSKKIVSSYADLKYLIVSTSIKKVRFHMFLKLSIFKHEFCN